MLFSNDPENINIDFSISKKKVPFGKGINSREYYVSHKKRSWQSCITGMDDFLILPFRLQYFVLSRLNIAEYVKRDGEVFDSP